jgi:hypothetical protein
VISKVRACDQARHCIAEDIWRQFPAAQGFLGPAVPLLYLADNLQDPDCRRNVKHLWKVLMNFV